MNQFKKIKLRNAGETVMSQRQQRQQQRQEKQQMRQPSLIEQVRQGVSTNNINQPSRYKLR